MKVAIIGCGVIAHTHIKTAIDCGESVVALCDVDIEKAKALAKENGLNCHVYRDYKTMLANESVDVVHVCTPHYLHCEMAVYALKKGVNVLLEKPLCISPSEIDAILSAEAESKGILGVCFQNRYNLSVLAAKQYLKDKKIAAAHGEVCWNRGEEYYRSGKWRGKLLTEGGGVLINQAVHTLDLLRVLCGNPTRVTAKCENWYHKGIIEVEDVVSAVFFGEDEGNFDFFATTDATADLPAQITIKTTDRHVVIVLPDAAYADGKILLFDPKKEFIGKSCYGKGHSSLIPDFYDAVKTGRKFPIDGKEAAKVMRLVFAVYKSNGNEIIL